MSPNRNADVNSVLGVGFLFADIRLASYIVEINSCSKVLCSFARSLQRHTAQFTSQRSPALGSSSRVAIEPHTIKEPVPY